jgi:hypothetical protein
LGPLCHARCIACEGLITNPRESVSRETFVLLLGSAVSGRRRLRRFGMYADRLRPPTCIPSEDLPFGDDHSGGAAGAR